MYSGGRDMFAPRWKLHHLDRLLAQLTRPALPGAGVPSDVRDKARALGVPVPRQARREELIAQVWGRKRPLLRQLSFDDQPMPPCA